MSVTITDLTAGMTIAELAEELEQLEQLDQQRAECAAEAGMSAAAMGFDPDDGIAVYNAGTVHTPWKIEARARVEEENATRRPVAIVPADIADDLPF